MLRPGPRTRAADSRQVTKAGSRVTDPQRTVSVWQAHHVRRAEVMRQAPGLQQDGGTDRELP